MNKFLKCLCTLFTLFFCFKLKAQSQIATSGTLNDTMRSHDKIYVVMAICITILLGLIFYIIRIDKKITQLESSNSQL